MNHWDVTDMGGDPAGEDGRGARLVALLGLVGYALIARSVENLYPFSTFPMYSQPHGEVSSRLVAREPSGRLREVTSYRRWSCPEAPRALPDPARCPEMGETSGSYVDHDLLDYITRHSGGTAGSPESQGQPVELVREVWRLDDEATRGSECVIQQCRALPQPGSWADP